MKGLLAKAHKAVVRFAVGCSVITIPFLIAVRPQGEPIEGGILGVLNTVAFIWILSLAYLVLALVFHAAFRESVLARLAGFRERDEREQHVTASAARGTFLIMLAVQIVFLMMSLTTVRITREPEDKKHTLSVGVQASSEQLDLHSLPPEPEPVPGFDIGGRLLPPNLSPLLALLILIQVGSFKFLSRRHDEAAC